MIGESGFSSDGRDQHHLMPSAASRASVPPVSSALSSGGAWKETTVEPTGDVSHDPVAEELGVDVAPPPPPSSTGRMLLKALPATVLAGLLLWFAVPRVVGSTVHDISYSFSVVRFRDAVWLTLLWAAGLWVWTFAQAVALPGVGTGRALTLNMTGSAVSNLLPGGGAAGMWLNYVMMKRWGYTKAEFSAYTLLINVAMTLMKLLLPTVALGALLLSGDRVSSSMRWTALIATIVLCVVLVGSVVLLVSSRLTSWVLGWLTPALAVTARLWRRRPDPDHMAEVLHRFRDHVAVLLKRRWPQLVCAALAYAVLQSLLLWACLQVLGAGVDPAMVLAAYAVNGVLSLIPITPGGAGFTEAGMAGALVALGGPAAECTAGVLLWRGFVFALEIPVGAVWITAWFGVRRRREAS